MNQTIIKGTLIDEPFSRTYNAGKSEKTVTMYTLAVLEYVNGKSETTFIPCVSWNNLGVLAKQHFHKGTEVKVRGKLHNNDYTNKKGEKVSKIELIVLDQAFDKAQTFSSL